MNIVFLFSREWNKAIYKYLLLWYVRGNIFSWDVLFTQCILLTILFTSGGNQSSMNQLQTTGVNEQIVGSIASNIAKGLFRYLALFSYKIYFCSYKRFLSLEPSEIFMYYYSMQKKKNIWNLSWNFSGIFCFNKGAVTLHYFATLIQHWRECSCLPKCTPVSHWTTGVWGDWQCCQRPNEVS